MKKFILALIILIIKKQKQYSVMPLNFLVILELLRFRNCLYNHFFIISIS